jgi:hypothetical protein
MLGVSMHSGWGAAGRQGARLQVRHAAYRNPSFHDARLQRRKLRAMASKDLVWSQTLRMEMEVGARERR